MADVYLIWSHEHRSWWGPDGRGYTERLSQAGRYSHMDALRICTNAMPGTSMRLGALPELPVRLEDVETMVLRFKDKYRGLPAESWE